MFDLGPTAVYAAIDDPDAIHARAVGVGVDIVMELTDQEYGSRGFAARDPEGNVWCFGTFRPGTAWRDGELRVYEVFRPRRVG